MTIVHMGSSKPLSTGQCLPTDIGISSPFPFQTGGDKGAQRDVRPRAEEVEESSMRQGQPLDSRRSVHHKPHREE